MGGKGNNGCSKNIAHQTELTTRNLTKCVVLQMCYSCEVCSI